MAESALEDYPADQVDLVEFQIVSQALLADFHVLGVKAVTDVAAVIEACCTLPGLPRPMKRYALKVMLGTAGDGEQGALGGVPDCMRLEWRHSNSLPPHANVVRVLRVGVHSLEGATAAALSAAFAGEAHTAGVGSFPSWDVPAVRSVLPHLPAAVKSALLLQAAAVGGSDDAAAETTVSVPPHDATILQHHQLAAGAVPPRLAFAVSECGSGSLAAARATLPGPLPFATLFPLALQLSRALAHAAAHRVVHRDLHPGNVLVMLSPQQQQQQALGQQANAPSLLLASAQPRFQGSRW